MSTSVSEPAATETITTRTSLPRSILLGLLTSVLLDFSFPVAGPMPHARSLLAWIALVPLLYALLSNRSADEPHYLSRAALTAWLSGVLWYALNCYWIYQTMLYYGHVSPPGCVGIVLLFSAILGLYFALFGVLLAFFRRRLGLAWALTLAPFLWTAIDLAAARITSVPWDQLGYSQIDNLGLAALAPFTGVYGITCALVLFNVVFASLFLPIAGRRRWRHHFAAWIIIILMAHFLLKRPDSGSMATSAYAVLLQPNIDVATNDNWQGQEWDGNAAWLQARAAETCTPAYTGMPGPKQPVVRQPAACAQNTPPPSLVLWPEVGSWFKSDDPRTLSLLAQVATTAHAPVIAGLFGEDPNATYNSALLLRPDGSIAGRYDKIHLVPFGEYIPYRSLFFFAHQLTHQLEDLQRGHTRTVFALTSASGQTHTVGIFICYESIFADEVRHFALNGAQVLVNLSDDGWYGDTSAPWQHLNMARMRAVENRRWLLRDTNNGVTTVIDPWGRVTLSAPRHTLTSLVARYGYSSELTFYTRYGDLFAYLCCLIAITGLIAAFLPNKPIHVKLKKRHPSTSAAPKEDTTPPPPRDSNFLQ
ncbi:MAG: apolipoprotein N-acyltransferase [Acidobacteriaceae bacterium]